MATPTYDLLDSVTLSSGATEVTFSSIDQNYRDLILHYEVTTTGADSALVEFNGDSTSTYSTVVMRTTGSTPFSGTINQSRVYLGVAISYLDGPGTQTMQIMDYSATDKHKSGLVRQNLIYSGGGATAAAAFRWPSTSAITSIRIYNGAGNNFQAGGTFYLYGVAG